MWRISVRQKKSGLKNLQLLQLNVRLVNADTVVAEAARHLVAEEVSLAAEAAV